MLQNAFCITCLIIPDAVAAKFYEESGKFKILIIDSIMALFRVDYSGRGELATRQQHLGQYLSRLQKLAEEYNVAVFITNQMTADPGKNPNKLNPETNRQFCQPPRGYYELPGGPQETNWRTRSRPRFHCATQFEKGTRRNANRQNIRQSWFGRKWSHLHHCHRGHMRWKGIGFYKLWFQYSITWKINKFVQLSEYRGFQFVFSGPRSKNGYTLHKQCMR